jgi:hypothetical protein
MCGKCEVWSFSKTHQWTPKHRRKQSCSQIVTFIIGRRQPNLHRFYSMRDTKFQEIRHNETRDTKENVLSTTVKCPYLLINPKHAYIVYTASVGSGWYEVSEKFLRKKPGNRRKTHFTQRLKCPSLLTDWYQPYNICSSCEESAKYAVSGNSLELQTRY